jgi:hypothetical protein
LPAAVVGTMESGEGSTIGGGSRLISRRMVVGIPPLGGNLYPVWKMGLVSAKWPSSLPTAWRPFNGTRAEPIQRFSIRSCLCQHSLQLFKFTVIPNWPTECPSSGHPPPFGALLGQTIPPQGRGLPLFGMARRQQANPAPMFPANLHGARQRVKLLGIASKTGYCA